MKKVSVEECQKLSISILEGALRYDSALELNDQLIKSTRTKCNYGGDRVWFLCPACDRRVGALYRPPLKFIFLCRHCHNLTYDLRKYHRSAIEENIKALKSATRGV